MKITVTSYRKSVYRDGCLVRLDCKGWSHCLVNLSSLAISVFVVFAFNNLFPRIPPLPPKISTLTFSSLTHV